MPLSDTALTQPFDPRDCPSSRRRWPGGLTTPELVAARCRTRARSAHSPRTLSPQAIREGVARVPTDGSPVLREPLRAPGTDPGRCRRSRARAGWLVPISPNSACRHRWRRRVLRGSRCAVRGACWRPLPALRASPSACMPRGQVERLHAWLQGAGPRPMSPRRAPGALRRQPIWSRPGCGGEAAPRHLHPARTKPPHRDHGAGAADRRRGAHFPSSPWRASWTARDRRASLMLERQGATRHRLPRFGESGTHPAWKDRAAGRRHRHAPPGLFRTHGARSWTTISCAAWRRGNGPRCWPIWCEHPHWRDACAAALPTGPQYMSLWAGRGVAMGRRTGAAEAWSAMLDAAGDAAALAPGPRRQRAPDAGTGGTRAIWLVARDLRLVSHWTDQQWHRRCADWFLGRRVAATEVRAGRRSWPGITRMAAAGFVDKPVLDARCGRWQHQAVVVLLLTGLA